MQVMWHGHIVHMNVMKITLGLVLPQVWTWFKLLLACGLMML